VFDLGFAVSCLLAAEVFPFQSQRIDEQNPLSKESIVTAEMFSESTRSRV
jgi:hypothetical protein